MGGLGEFSRYQGSDDISEPEEAEMSTHTGGRWNVGLFESRSS